MGVREAGSPSNCQVLVRGELKDKGPEVPRGVLTVLKTPQAAHIDPRHSGRLELAHWIASKDNPLTARVMVNRVWEHLFGQGLVDTVDNFGAWGTSRVIPNCSTRWRSSSWTQKWSVKKLIRSIVLSRVYQLSSEHDAENYEIDPSNRFLWRMERRRLDAEEIRDAMLVASGQLDRERPEGSPVMELGNGTGSAATRNCRKSASRPTCAASTCRSCAAWFPRCCKSSTWPIPSLIVGKRDVTTVPTQALFLMNNPFVLKQSDEMAKRILEQKDLDQASAHRSGVSAGARAGRQPSTSGPKWQNISTIIASGRTGGPEGKSATGCLDQRLPDVVSKRRISLRVLTMAIGRRTGREP